MIDKVFQECLNPSQQELLAETGLTVANSVADVLESLHVKG